MSSPNEPFAAPDHERIKSVPRPRYEAPLDVQLTAALDAIDDLDQIVARCIAALHDARPHLPPGAEGRVHDLLVELGEEVP